MNPAKKRKLDTIIEYLSNGDINVAGTFMMNLQPELRIYIASFLPVADIISMCKISPKVEEWCQNNYDLWNMVLQRSYGRNAMSVQELSGVLKTYYPDEAKYFDNVLNVIAAYSYTMMVSKGNKSLYMSRTLNTPNSGHLASIRHYTLDNTIYIEITIQMYVNKQLVEHGDVRFKKYTYIQKLYEFLLSNDSYLDSTKHEDGEVASIVLQFDSLLRSRIQLMRVFVLLSGNGYVVSANQMDENSLKSKICFECTIEPATVQCTTCDLLPLLCNNCAQKHKD